MLFVGTGGSVGYVRAVPDALQGAATWLVSQYGRERSPEPAGPSYKAFAAADTHETAEGSGATDAAAVSELVAGPALMFDSALLKRYRDVAYAAELTRCLLDT